MSLGICDGFPTAKNRMLYAFDEIADVSFTLKATIFYND